MKFPFKRFYKLNCCIENYYHKRFRMTKTRLCEKHVWLEQWEW